MSSKLMIPTQRVFHGWFVVAAAFAVCFMGFGSAYPSAPSSPRCRRISPPRAVLSPWSSIGRVSLLRPRDHQRSAGRPVGLSPSPLPA